MGKVKICNKIYCSGLPADPQPGVKGIKITKEKDSFTLLPCRHFSGPLLVARDNIACCHETATANHRLQPPRGDTS